MAETQEGEDNDEQYFGSVILKESLTSWIDSPQEHQERYDDNLSIVIENKLRTFFEATEKRFTKYRTIQPINDRPIKEWVACYKFWYIKQLYSNHLISRKLVS